MEPNIDIINDSKKLRDLADHYAKLMKQSFEKSQKAWKENNKALAKELSDKGKTFQILLDQCNTKQKSISLLEKANKKNSNSNISNMINFDEIYDEDFEINSSKNLEYREKAQKNGEKMIEAFSGSQKMWKNGDKAKAKELSDKGYEYKKKMEEYNKKAGKSTYIQKNKEKELNEIDLHGLFVKEALEILDKKIISLKSNYSLSELIVIVGKGIHSQGEPKLRNAVLEFAKKKNLIRIEHDNEGCLAFIIE